MMEAGYAEALACTKSSTLDLDHGRQQQCMKVEQNRADADQRSG